MAVCVAKVVVYHDYETGFLRGTYTPHPQLQQDHPLFRQPANSQTDCQIEQKFTNLFLLF